MGVGGSALGRHAHLKIPTLLKPKRTHQAVLTELARVRLHGLSKREVAISRAKLMADAEAVYIERDQVGGWIHAGAWCACVCVRIGQPCKRAPL